MISTDAPDANTAKSFTFLYQTDVNAKVFGFGNARRDTGFTNLTVTFAGMPVQLFDGENRSFRFTLPTFTAKADKTFALTFSFASATKFNEIDFDIETAVVPVPAAGGLLLLALGGIAALRRRKAV